MVCQQGRRRRRLSERDCRKRQYGGGSSTAGKRSRHATWTRWRSPCTAYGYKVERWNRGVWECMVPGAGIEELCFALPRDACAGLFVHSTVIFTWLSLSSPFFFPLFHHVPPSPSRFFLSSLLAHSYPLPSHHPPRPITRASRQSSHVDTNSICRDACQGRVRPERA
jgi:hypothetical protein